MLELKGWTNEGLLDEFELQTGTQSKLDYPAPSSRRGKIRKEILRRMKGDSVPIQARRKTVDGFIRSVVRSSRKKGYNVRVKDFAELREHLLQK